MSEVICLWCDDPIPCADDQHDWREQLIEHYFVCKKNPLALKLAEAKSALANCHMSARRGIASPTVAHQQLRHIVRFCEEAGVTIDILRTSDFKRMCKSYHQKYDKGRRESLRLNTTKGGYAK